MRRWSLASEARWLLTPHVLGAVVLVGVPAVLAIGIAFFRYDTLSPPVWYGWLNFKRVFVDPRLRIAVVNSLEFAVLAVPLRVAGALSLALLFNGRGRGQAIYRALVCIPTLLPDVAYALIWLWLFNPVSGPLNILLGTLGLPPLAWLADGRTALMALVIMAAFQLGEGFVIFLAGLNTISPDYYAAATVDGGNRWQLFWHITWPLLQPWLIVLTVRDILLTFQISSTSATLMTGGDPYYATLFLPMLAMEEAFVGLRFGQGAVLMVLLLLLAVGLIGGLWLFFRGWGYADEV